MEVIIIYGPPASGKMTITKELCKITTAKYFPHNLVFDIINPIFGVNTKDDDLWDLYEDLKIDIIKTAKKKNLSLILTEIYNNPLSNERFEEFIDELKKAKVEYKFVKVGCSKEELLKRVEKADRKNTKKLNSAKEYQRIMQESQLNEKIPFVKSLVIENTNISAKKVAQMIKKELKLK